VYTHEVIAFSNVNDTQLLDQIPLRDIVAIEKMNVSSGAQQMESTIETTVDFTDAFQIRTKKDGYNAGRSYFFRSESGGDLASLIQGISSVAELAVQKATVRSNWVTAREQSRILYNSSWFQGVAAFLIIAVSAALTRHHSQAAPQPPVTPNHGVVGRISGSPFSRRNCKQTSFTRPMDP
jgi:hypothetical protein